MTHEPGCRYTCASCGRLVCREQETSPAEADDICVDCYHQEVPDDAA